MISAEPRGRVTNEELGSTKRKLQRGSRVIQEAQLTSNCGAAHIVPAGLRAISAVRFTRRRKTRGLPGRR